MRLATACWLGMGALSAWAQDGLAGKGQYPQARTLSGLSGGGVPVRPDGRPGMDGALALSTPIGYTLGANRVLAIGSNTSAGRSFRWFDGNSPVNGANGSAAILFGAGHGSIQIAVTWMQTSRLSEDRVVNLQVSPPNQGRLGLSFGVQDALDQTVTTPDYEESASSAFGAATYHAGDGVYLTAGHGTRRFSRGFAGASAPVGKRARAMLEYDGYGWNYGAAFDLGSYRATSGGRTQVSAFVGLIQGRYLTWSLALRY
jgi:hypothetical protein